MFAQTAASLALAAAVLAAGSAVQAADYPSASVQVRVSDIDLSTAAGQDRLMDRVNSAAASVCGGYQGRRSGSEERAYRACRAQAVSAAMPQLRQAIAEAHDHPQYAMTPRTESAAN